MLLWVKTHLSPVPTEVASDGPTCPAVPSRPPGHWAIHLRARWGQPRVRGQGQWVRICKIPSWHTPRRGMAMLELSSFPDHLDSSRVLNLVKPH